MTIVKRVTEVKCDGRACDCVVTVDHDLAYECDGGYAFSQALDRGGWVDVWLSNSQGYGHLCPECREGREAALLAARRRRDAKLEKRRGYA